MAIRTKLDPQPPAPPPVKPLAGARQRLARLERRAKPKRRKPVVTEAGKAVARANLAKGRKKIADSKPVHMNLHRSHCVIGVGTWGPGPSMVPASLVPVFSEAERLYEDSERGLHEDRAFIVGARNTIRRVDPSVFDYTLGQAAPISVIDGR